MKNHPLYKKMKQVALDDDYTIEQVQTLSFSQAAELLETRDFTITFLSNMKRGIIDALCNRDDELTMEQLKQATRTWLDLNFPSWEAERGRQGEKPYIIIWLEGKP